MQKLDQIQKFVVLAEGEDATFVHPVGQADNSRLIKMRINALRHAICSLRRSFTITRKTKCGRI